MTIFIIVYFVSMLIAGWLIRNFAENHLHDDDFGKFAAVVFPVFNTAFICMLIVSLLYMLSIRIITGRNPR